MIHYMID